MHPGPTTEYMDDGRQSLLEKFLFPVRKIKQQRLARFVDGKTVLITGASFGIGARLAEKLSHCNVTLVLMARSADRLEALREQLRSQPVWKHRN